MKEQSQVRFFLKRIGICLTLVFCIFYANGQKPVSPPDTSRTKQVNVDFSNLFEFRVEGKDTYQKLLGDVRLRQDSVYMYCDSATIKNGSRVYALGNVLIQHGDSVSVFADSALYQGDMRLADLYGEVVLINLGQKLFTDSLHYDLNTRIASYNSGATLTDDTTQLRSVRGYYFVNTKEIFFKENVVVVSPDFTLKADTLKFNTETRVVTFLGPTIISTKDNGRIFCESGFYDTRNQLAEFTTHPQYQKGTQKAAGQIIRYDGRSGTIEIEAENREAFFQDSSRFAKADLIRYDERNDIFTLSGKTGNAIYQDKDNEIEAAEIIYDKKNEKYSTKGRSRVSEPPQLLEADQIDFDNVRGVGVASGNLVWRDTAEQLTILADQADFDRKNDYLRTSGGRAWLISVVEGDTLFLRCDTLVSQRRDTAASDTSRVLHAFHKVRIFKSDMQATCDSLTYSATDSVFKFFGKPVLWSDTSQFTADTMHIRLSDGDIEQVLLLGDAFIINSPDERFFNQVKGKQVTASFSEQNLRQMLVQGNAESVYYILDDKNAYIGVNKTICSEMLILFGNNEVDQIKFFVQPKATIIPMRQAKHEELAMEGFRWIVLERPKSKFDL
jgi:lipopolysaccharide export system protein LptA